MPAASFLAFPLSNRLFQFGTIPANKMEPTILDKNMNRVCFSCVCVLIVFFIATLESTAFPSRKSNLDPVSEEFVSTARYLLTLKGKKALTRLSPKERQLFIRDFWKMRDPPTLSPRSLNSKLSTKIGSLKPTRFFMMAPLRDGYRIGDESTFCWALRTSKFVITMDSPEITKGGITSDSVRSRLRV